MILEDREKIVKEELRKMQREHNLNQEMDTINNELLPGQDNIAHTIDNNDQSEEMLRQNRIGLGYKPYDDIDLSKIDTKKILSKNRVEHGVRLAFGSCFDTRYFHDKYKIFKNIAGQQPDIWVWLGDSIYTPSNFLFYKYQPSFSKIQSYYDSVKNNENYTILQNKSRIVGVYDDKDYGMDDGDASNPNKIEMKKLF